MFVLTGLVSLKKFDNQNSYLRCVHISTANYSATLKKIAMSTYYRRMILVEQVRRVHDSLSEWL